MVVALLTDNYIDQWYLAIVDDASASHRFALTSCATWMPALKKISTAAEALSIRAYTSLAKIASDDASP